MALCHISHIRHKPVIEEANPHDLVYSGHNYEGDSSMGRR